MTNHSDDAQRNLEQKALRNVRALVDKIETKDELDRKSVRKHLVVIVVAVIVVFSIAAVVFNLTVKTEPARTYVLPPPANATQK